MQAEGLSKAEQSTAGVYTLEEWLRKHPEDAKGARQETEKDDWPGAAAFVAQNGAELATAPAAGGQHDIALGLSERREANSGEAT